MRAAMGLALSEAGQELWDMEEMQPGEDQTSGEQAYYGAHLRRVDARSRTTV